MRLYKDLLFQEHWAFYGIYKQLRTGLQLIYLLAIDHLLVGKRNHCLNILILWPIFIYKSFNIYISMIYKVVCL